MNMVESLDAHADRLERNASALDAREDAIRDKYRQAFDECLAKLDIDEPLAGGYFQDLADLISLACMDGDQTIHRELTMVFLRCALLECRPDAVAVVDKLRDYFVKQMMEMP